MDQSAIGPPRNGFFGRRDFSSRLVGSVRARYANADDRSAHGMPTRSMRTELRREKPAPPSPAPATVPVSQRARESGPHTGRSEKVTMSYRRHQFWKTEVGENQCAIILVSTCRKGSREIALLEEPAARERRSREDHERSADTPHDAFEKEERDKAVCEEAREKRAEEAQHRARERHRTCTPLGISISDARRL